jgi:predicted permease
MMARLRRLVHRCRNLFRLADAEPDLARELAAHLQLVEDDFRRRGLSQAEARLAARRALGGVEQIKELHRDARSFGWFSDAAQDVRHGARLLRRDPLFTLTAALSLAIGIGATTSAFTVADALLFRPPAGVMDAGRLVDIGSTRGRGAFGPSSYPDYSEIRRRAGTLSAVYAYSRFPHTIGLGGASAGTPSETVLGTFVTVNYFTALGAVPAAGRVFDSNDSDQPGASPVAILSDAFWARRFNKDPTVVGRALTLNGQAFTVVGVAAGGFLGTGIRGPDMWLPIGMAPAILSEGAAALTNRSAPWLFIGGRLNRGVPLSQAAAEMDVIGRTLDRERPAQNQGAGLRLLASSPVPGDRGPIVAFLVLLIAIVSSVLVVACANVAGVLLARATARRQEIAVRLTMGAGRARLVRQMLTETILLFVLGEAAGLLLAHGMTSFIVSRLPVLPFSVDVLLTLDGRAMAFSTALVLVAALFSGLVPALHGSKADLVAALKDDAQAPARLRLRHAFVIAQVALSILLVCLAGLCARALRQASTADPGFNAHGVELASLDLSQAGYTTATGPVFVRELVDRVHRLPDVQAATVAAAVPGGFETMRSFLTVPGVTPPGGDEFFSLDWNIVEPGYFETLQIPIAAGRDFGAADRTGAPRSIILSEAAAKQFWPGAPARDAIGRSLVQPVFGPGGLTGEMRTLRVVGLVNDVKATTLIDGVSRAAGYVPMQQEYAQGVTIIARTTRGQRMTEPLRVLVASMNPRLSIVTAQTLEESLQLGLTAQRIVAAVAGGLGLVGLLLAALGIYGVTAYVVARRTREIGIRMALGASRSDVIRLILRQGLWLIAGGAVAGLMFAAAAGRVLTAYLFGIPAVDPVTYIGVAALFALVGLAACYVPVRRATRINALEALRYE